MTKETNQFGYPKITLTREEMEAAINLFKAALKLKEIERKEKEAKNEKICCNAMA